MDRLTWSSGEKRVARRAFEKAYAAECAELLAQVREMAAAAQEPRDLWRIHDFLEEQRRQTDQKYDYRYSQLVVVFARLIHDGRLSLDELEGLHEDKLAKIQLILSLAER